MNVSLPVSSQETSCQAHHWLIGRPSEGLSGAVCKTCGVRRDFNDGFKHPYSGRNRGTKGPAHNWIAGMEEALAEQRDAGVTRLNDADERRAQRLACTSLVEGCEGAVSEFLVALSADAKPSPVTLRARELLAQVLSSWRDTLNTLRTAEQRAR